MKLSRVIIVIVAVLALIFVFSMVGGSGSEEESADKVTATHTPEATADTEETKEEEPADNVVRNGESYENDGLKFTVKNVDTNFRVKDDDYGLYEPKKGKKYIAVTFTFENNGAGSKYVSIYDFDCYADNESATQEYISTDEDDDFINENLSPGRKVTFTTYYSVPKKAKSIQLEYTPDFWSEEKVIVEVK